VKELKSKVVIITGASAGIGKAAALAAADAGARLILADREEDAGIAVCAEARARGAQAQFLKVDVANEADVARMVDAALTAYGRLDGAFNNAAIASLGVPLVELTLELYERTQSINLRGVFLCMKSEIQAMVRTGGGAIVNTSSAAAISAIPNAAEYSAAKAGILGITRSAAFDYGPKGVRVNAILPGATRTAMVLNAAAKMPGLEKALAARQPIGRLLEPEEVAAAALWLISDAASAVTGVCMPVDGGMTLS
jgi:NAD(P)-dependent dehydrogenase (short-subunit alcohol dehydrogenase family)